MSAVLTLQSVSVDEAAQVLCGGKRQAAARLHHQHAVIRYLQQSGHKRLLTTNQPAGIHRLAGLYLYPGSGHVVQQPSSRHGDPSHDAVLHLPETQQKGDGERQQVQPCRPEQQEGKH